MDEPALYSAEAERSWSDMTVDAMELIFSKLPESCVHTAGGTCKRWRSVSKEFLQWSFSQEKSPKIVVIRVYGDNYSFTYKDGSYLIESVEPGPTVFYCEDGNAEIPCVEASGGLRYAFTGDKQSKVVYKLGRVEDSWRVTPEIPRPMQDPVVGAVVESAASKSTDHKLVFAGCESYLLEDGNDLAVSIYDAQTDSWENCDSLPSEFSGNTGCLCMGSVVHREIFYVYDKIRGYVSRLGIESKRWSEVKLVNPPVDVSELILVSQSRKLFLVGVGTIYTGDLCFKVWNVDEDTMLVGELVSSKTFLKGRGTPLTGIMRRTLEPFARCVGVLLILILYLIRLCHSVTIWIDRKFALGRALSNIKLDGDGNSELQEDRRFAPQSMANEQDQIRN